VCREMYHGVRAYSGKSHTQVLAAVAIEGERLRFVKGSHSGLEVRFAARADLLQHANDPTRLLGYYERLSHSLKCDVGGESKQEILWWSSMPC